MRRAMRIVFTGLAILVALAGIVVGGAYVWVSNPKHERLPLPPELISLESAEGKTLLAESVAKVDHETLEAHYQTQEKQSWCGVASAAIVLNSFPAAAPLPQIGFFDECTSNIRSSFRTTFGGIPIDSLAQMMQCHGAEARVLHAEDSSLEEFRRLVAENLRVKGNFVVVNYERAGVGQKPSGHISPLSAYHEASDRFLILDVASYKYPSVWVKASALWSAMNTLDPESKRTRGYMLVAPSAQATN
jgi:hypothetical protein